MSALPTVVSRRRRLLGRPAIAAHRLALALVRRLPARAGGAEGDAVRIVLSNPYAMGGTVRAVFTLAEQLAERRPVEIVGVRRHARQPFFAFPAGVEVTVLDDRVEGRGRLQRLLRAVPSLLVHPEDFAYPGSSLWSDLLLLRRLRGPGGTVITSRPAWTLVAAAALPPGAVLIGQEHMHLRAHRPALAADIRRRYRRLDALAVLTEGDRADYAPLLDRVEVMPNPVPRLSGPGADPDAKVVVAAGRLTRQKGFDLLIAAFAAGARDGWELRIYGGGKDREALERQIAEAGLEGRVRLMGRTRALGEAFGEASVFALSSRFEGFGVVLVEAMGCGLAVVSFDCPRGPGDIVTDGRDGVLVPPEDVDALARELGALMDDGDRRRALGAAARERAAAYEPEAVARRWDALLGTLRRATPAQGATQRS